MKALFRYFMIVVLGVITGCKFDMPDDKILQECIVPNAIVTEADPKNPRKFLCSLNKPPTNITGNISWSMNGSGSAGSAGLTSIVEFTSIGLYKIYVSFKTACGGEITLSKEVNVPAVVDRWNQLGNYPGQGRTQMMAVYAGGNLIVGLGKKTNAESTNDIWVFDYAGNWRRLADYPGMAQVGTFSFPVNGLTVGMGTMEGGSIVNEVWQFDQTRNVWNRKKDFPIKTANLMANFSLFTGNGQERGYVITNEKKMYEYDGTFDTWTEKSAFPGNWRTQSVAFQIGLKVYLGTGKDTGNAIYYDDFWEYEPARDIWTRKADFPGGKRSSAFGFGYDNNGYVGEGINFDPSKGEEVPVKDFWQYSTATNTWSKKGVYGSGSLNAVGASTACFGGKCFVFCGFNNNTVWEYIP